MSEDTASPNDNDYFAIKLQCLNQQPTNILALIMLLTNMLKFNDSASDMVVVSDVNREVMSPGQTEQEKPLTIATGSSFPNVKHKHKHRNQSLYPTPTHLFTQSNTTTRRSISFS